MAKRLFLLLLLAPLMVGCSHKRVEISKKEARALIKKAMTRNFGQVSAKQIRVTIPVLSRVEHKQKSDVGFRFSAIFDYEVPTYQLFAFPGGMPHLGTYYVYQVTPPHSRVHATGVAWISPQHHRIDHIDYTGGGFDGMGLLMSQIRQQAAKVIVLTPQQVKDLTTPESPEVKHFRAQMKHLSNLHLQGHL